MKTFFFHYNKPASQKAKRAQISVHFNKTCYIVDNIICSRPTFGKINERAPKFIMKGKCNRLKIDKGIAIID